MISIISKTMIKMKQITVEYDDSPQERNQNIPGNCLTR